MCAFSGVQSPVVRRLENLTVALKGACPASCAALFNVFERVPSPVRKCRRTQRHGGLVMRLIPAHSLGARVQTRTCHTYRAGAFCAGSRMRVCVRARTHKGTRTFRGPGRAVAKLFSDPVGKAIPVGIRAIADEPIEVRIVESEGVEGVHEACDGRPSSDLAKQADGLRRGLVPTLTGEPVQPHMPQRRAYRGESLRGRCFINPAIGTAPTARPCIAATRLTASEAMSASLCMRPSASRSADILRRSAAAINVA